jgi:hypothetical protein
MLNWIAAITVAMLMSYTPAEAHECTPTDPYLHVRVTVGLGGDSVLLGESTGIKRALKHSKFATFAVSERTLRDFDLSQVAQTTKVDGWVLAFGANDARKQDLANFKADLSRIVAERKSAGQFVVLVTPPYPDPIRYPVKMGEFAEAVRQVGAAQGVCVADRYATMSIAGKWQRDGVHPATNTSLSINECIRISVK